MAKLFIQKKVKALHKLAEKYNYKIIKNSGLKSTYDLIPNDLNSTNHSYFKLKDYTEIFTILKQIDEDIEYAKKVKKEREKNNKEIIQKYLQEYEDILELLNKGEQQ